MVVVRPVEELDARGPGMTQPSAKAGSAKAIVVSLERRSGCG